MAIHSSVILYYRVLLIRYFTSIHGAAAATGADAPAVFLSSILAASSARGFIHMAMGTTTKEERRSLG